MSNTKPDHVHRPYYLPRNWQQANSGTYLVARAICRYCEREFILERRPIEINLNATSGGEVDEKIKVR